MRNFFFLVLVKLGFVFLTKHLFISSNICFELFFPSFASMRFFVRFLRNTLFHFSSPVILLAAREFHWFEIKDELSFVLKNDTYRRTYASTRLDKPFDFNILRWMEKGRQDVKNFWQCTTSMVTIVPNLILKRIYLIRRVNSRENTVSRRLAGDGTMKLISIVLSYRRYKNGLRFENRQIMRNDRIYHFGVLPTNTRRLKFFKYPRWNEFSTNFLLRTSEACL